MGFNFRKSLKIAPGIRLNLGKKGVSSVSVGTKGARVSIGKKGTRTTVGIPGTGLSHTTFNSHKSRQPQSLNIDKVQNYVDMAVDQNRKVSFLLGFGIFWMPYIFSWFTLRSGYSNRARWISFIWMILVLIILNSD
ncbi:DUF4236 domain-containing protein [Acinetobacter baumannii]|uniref:DUF4236 domain-containing protein n=1 Tax=Acinetobacter baumannii TaxID=470 RepID=UPI0011C4D083|nr:DUF4236 domain-containing protein [Acinetobacter baumannii]HEM7282276.1 DUF4236 domain-containing protein [Acinetobacter nosocomialis]EKU8698876.1 DUF4236 domain-containing protein [Acinetobacter baumannii]EKV0094599.1 DUF4236 domain-containing protein [Acinetobacter baumannii]ELB0773913.1 DUF4236 domain-containing protein [Acinetobacter baumannii]MCE6411691.1 DUF4236 domain-containing protein [Acinetobacter baumannii]